jgi:NAD(P)-dependent dehydrogenase (short-subunit alcohol dehydrogenase family)
MDDVEKLDGRVAVITGGAGGIGKAMAERFAGEGMKLVLADLKQDALDIAVADLTAAGAEAIGVRTDVSSLESVEALRDATLDRFGAVHVVCNNAGVASGAHGRLWEHEINDWRFAMSVHVYGVINGINAFVPHLIEAGEECHVVNTSSNNGGFSPIAQSPTYSVCKAAVVTLSECLWGQLKDAGAGHVGVSVLFPTGRTQGILDTGIWAPAERPDEYTPQAPIDMSNKMQMWIEMQEAAGTPVQFTPLSEVADTVVEGLYADRFWMVEEGRFEEAVQQRTDIILRRADPDYQR